MSQLQIYKWSILALKRQKMIDSITSQENCIDGNYKYSIVIPTWNNLSYLKLCIRSIRENSHHKSQIIVIINEGKDGTSEWVQEQSDIDHIKFPSNVGICYAVNIARTIMKSELMVYLNDDMYVLPKWDQVLLEEIQLLNSKSFLLSSTLIEPVNTGNPCVVVKDYGTDLASFDEEKLLHDFLKIRKEDWSGSTWPPTIVHLDLWDLVGGYSIEFSPGLGSDPDFSRKLLEVGVRHFKGVGRSLVYHFVSKSTARVKGNNGRKTFLSKWNMTQSQFRNRFLQMGKKYTTITTLQGANIFERIANKLKRILQS